MPTSRTRSLSFLLVLTFLVAPPATAGFLDGFIGNGRCRTSNDDLDGTYAFAVLDRLTGASSSGDVFGTGFANFDTAVASGSEALYTTARYLYLYQDLNDGSRPGLLGLAELVVTGPLPIANQVTSVVHWNLVLSDDAGRYSLTNQFGQDDAPFEVDAFAIRGGIDTPGVTTPGSSLHAAVTFDYDPVSGIFTADYDPDLPLDAMGPLYGFTSDLPPAYAVPFDTPPSFCNGEYPRPSATGGFLADFIGNTRFTGATSVGTLDETWSFAVLDQLGSAGTPGDVFGTGFPTFDADTGIDTSARFLYLYQETNDGVRSDPIPVSPGWIAGGATSEFAVDLVLTDEDGPTTLTNQFGTDDGKTHSFDGTTTFGVVDPGLASSLTLRPASVEIDAPTGDLTVAYDPTLAPGEIGFLFGFTSNIRPILISYFGTNDDTPVPLPEPSTGLMLVVAIGGLLIGRSVRSTDRRAR